MKKHILATMSLAVSLFAGSASAQFVPVPTLEEAPLRLLVGVDGHNTWNPFSNQTLQANVAAVMGLGMGFDVGINLHGGVKDLLTNDNAMQGVIGTDVMIRYLTHVTDFLFLGLQAQVGYMQNLAVAPLVPDGGNIPVDVNLVLGFTLADIVNLYAAPGVEFGRRLLKTDGMFGPAIGGNVMAGVAVDLDGTLLILQAKPSVASFSNMSGTFSTDFLLALSWDL